MSLILGYSLQVRSQFSLWMDCWKKVAASGVPALPPTKIFTAKCNLPVLSDYSKPAPASYWDQFPKNLVQPAKSLVDGPTLEAMAIECGFEDLRLLDRVVRDLVEGADIGCKDPFRQAGMSSNAPSAVKNGNRVSDAIAVWVKKGFAYGPVKLNEVPVHAKFSGLMATEKPNGSVRIILNLSAPKGSCVNDGIDNSEFLTTMSSTKMWVKALWKAGKGCLMSKVDWSDAYKHVSVRKQDIDLQWFTWCGRAFKELCLIFGAVSSAGIYDRLAKIVLFIVIKRSGMDPELVCQYLDDCCACAPFSSNLLYIFDATFSEVAERLGIKLAPRDDPDKSFGPSTQGTIFGVYYDTVSWTWGLPEEKLIRLLHNLDRMLELDEVCQEVVWSVVGKIQIVKPLVPSGKYNMYHLIKAYSISPDKKALVPLSADFKRQIWFWRTMLPVCCGRASIPNLSDSLPPWTLEVYTDAAGGTCRSSGHGVGAVSDNWWVYLPWHKAINSGRRTDDDKRLDRVMSALELVGPLLGLCAASDACRNFVVRFWVDNNGSVCIFKKGYSPSCPLSSALVSAIACVAAGLGCRVELEEITRCSTPLAVMADALSKAAFGRFWQTAQQAGFSSNLKQLEVPQALLEWVENPTADFNLGRKLLVELSKRGPVLGL